MRGVFVTDTADSGEEREELIRAQAAAIRRILGINVALCLRPFAVTVIAVLSWSPGSCAQSPEKASATAPNNGPPSNLEPAPLRGLHNASSAVSAPLPAPAMAPGASLAPSRPEMAPSSVPRSPLSPLPSATSTLSSDLLNPAQPMAKPLSAIIGRDVDIHIRSGHAPSRRMQALHVSVHNRSDEPLVFDGDKSLIASRDTGSLVARCLSQPDLDNVERPPTTFKGKVAADLVASVTAAASVGVVQTVDTFKREYGPIPKRYEYDQARRTNEESRFGRRLLYPGDSTDGNIYFQSGLALRGKMLTIPVKSFYDGSTQSAVSVLIDVPD